MTRLDGVPAGGLAGATVADLEERLEHLAADLERERRRVAPPNEPEHAHGDRRRVLTGAIRRTREELARRGVR